MSPGFTFDGEKDGDNFQQWLFYCWGKEGRLGKMVMDNFVKLSWKYGWKEVYDIVEYAAHRNARNFLYCEASLRKKAEQAVEKSQAKAKSLVHCSKCFTSYWSDMRHVCEVTVIDEVEESPERVREIVQKLKAEWVENVV